MSMRQLVYNILTATPALAAVVGDRVVEYGALGAVTGQAPIKPYLIYKIVQELASLPGIEDLLFEFWVYCEYGDYGPVQEALAAIKDSLNRRAGDSVVVAGNKFSLIEASFQSASPDLSDDTLRANVRYATYRIVGSNSGQS